MNELTNNLFDVDGNIWIKKNNRNFIGRGRVELLQNIQLHGSISKAAKQMKMSYKAAWDSVDIMNKLSNKPLVTKVTGGKGGGGTVITSHAKELIQAFLEIESLHKNYFHTLKNAFNERIVDENSEEPVFSRLNGNITTMNQINNNYEITIALACGQELTCIESEKFVQTKQLKCDDEVQFLIETSNIVLTRDVATNSARNLLLGTIASIHDDGINSNITINCDKDKIHAKITTASCQKLQLKPNDTIYASFKAYNINII